MLSTIVPILVACRDDGYRAWPRQELHSSKRDGACGSKRALGLVPLPLVLLLSLHVPPGTKAVGM